MAPHTTMSDEDLELPEIQHNTSNIRHWETPAATMSIPAWEPIGRPVMTSVPAPKRRRAWKSPFFLLGMLLFAMLIAGIVALAVSVTKKPDHTHPAYEDDKVVFPQVGNHSANGSTSHVRNHPRFFPYPQITNSSHGTTGLNGTYHHHPPHCTCKTCHPASNASTSYRRAANHVRNITADEKGTALGIGLAGAAAGGSHIGEASLSTPSLMAAGALVAMQVLFLV